MNADVKRFTLIYILHANLCFESCYFAIYLVHFSLNACLIDITTLTSLLQISCVDISLNRWHSSGGGGGGLGALGASTHSATV